jgi:hydroxylamine oxidation protein HaoB
MNWTLKKSVLSLSCGLLLLSGSTLLVQQIRIVFFNDGEFKLINQIPLRVRYSQGKLSNLHGYFSVDSIDDYAIQRDDKDSFSLLLAHYKDGDNQQHRAVLFPKSKHETGLLPSSTELRQTIWQDAAKTIIQNTPKNTIILSWWDDGQRIHFLSGRNAWLTKPAKETFISPVWQNLQDNLLLASDTERERLSKMARWLTMDSDKALAEMRTFFGPSRPLYLLVNNDLLMRVGEMIDYGGTPLAFNSKTVPAHDNLHGDIALIKQWAYEEGDGNYLVQKEGLNYHLWGTPKLSGTEKNSLIVRLLPFVDSLKKLPEGIQLVYQSNWGGYLSIYKIDLN